MPSRVVSIAPGRYDPDETRQRHQAADVASVAGIARIASITSHCVIPVRWLLSGIGAQLFESAPAAQKMREAEAGRNGPRRAELAI